MKTAGFVLAACAAALAAGPAFAQHGPLDMGGQMTGKVMADRLEGQFGGGDRIAWDAMGWIGGDLNKLWLKSEGEYLTGPGEFEGAEAQALWSRAITPYFDFQAGVRQTLEPVSRTDAVIGVQGLAPQWFEVDAAAFIGDGGDVTARLQAEYEIRLTQRLYLQPRAELNLAAQGIPALGVASGVTDAQAGLRLRYEIGRKFAPYVGVTWRGAVGGTRDLVRLGGGDTDETLFVIGVRAWR